MKLTRARVLNYKNILDSSWVDIADIVCMVGKNESGKTAFLEALEKLSPVEGVPGDFRLLEYPRKELGRYRAVHEREPAVAIRAEFRLEPAEMESLELEYGPGLLKTDRVIAEKGYDNARRWRFKIDEGALTDAQREDFVSGRLQAEVSTQLDRLIPRFWRFDDYHLLPGRMPIAELAQAQAHGHLAPSQSTFLALLKLAGAGPQDFVNLQHYESLKAQLEAVSNGVSDDVFAFWSQNRELEVEFDVSQPDQPAPWAGPVLHVRIKDRRHRVSVPIDERSRGFLWFFSFMVAFSQLEAAGHAVVLLLDEPGHSLHAKAQQDLLRFIEERLAPRYQVIFTAHSPFLIDPARLDRVRTVQNQNGAGTVVSRDIATNDRDTVFPLKVALGYELANNLFLGPDALVVEGPADLIYLSVLSDALGQKGKPRLDARWNMVPVGGADRVCAFLSILGATQDRVAVISNAVAPGQQQTAGESLALVPLNAITQVPGAGLEDLFEPGFYTKLVAKAYGDVLPRKLKEADLPEPNAPLVQRWQGYFEQHRLGRFDRYRPAAALLQHQGRMLREIDRATLNRAAFLVEQLNGLLA